MRANFYAHGNRAGKLMAALIQKRKSKQKIPYILNPTQDNKMFHPRDIANAFKEYYRKLYNLKDDPSVKQPTDSNIENFLASLQLPTLSDEQLSTPNAPFTINEINHVISSLPNGKAPGPDGFFAEYYKSFSKTLNPYLCHIFNAAVSSGEFPSEMLSANIITLPKPGKEPVSPQNFHPISLLNTDLKIYAKLLVQRLTPLMPNIIHPDQVGFTLGRQAPDATRKIINLIHLSKSTKTPAIFVALDAEKAFDRIHWGYLTKTFTKFGFQGNILKAILALYSSPSARVFTDGILSEPFKITNGTRKGCPLSPLIFTLMMEPLAQTIRNNISIQGIQVTDQNHKITLFADDIILTLTELASSLPVVCDILDKFNACSFYKVNESKSNILQTGVANPIKRELQSKILFQCVFSSMSYLGISLTIPTNNLFSHNFTPFLNTCKQDLQKISKQHLSWAGRVAAFKMFTLPKLLYLYRALPIVIPDTFFKSLQSMLRSYIWSHKKPRCPHSVTIRLKKAGGMGLPDVKDYYVAVLLDQIRHWFTPTLGKQWRHIEQSFITKGDLRTLLLAEWVTQTEYYISHPTITAALRVWTYFVSNIQGITSDTKITIKLEIFQFIMPDLSLRYWADLRKETLSAVTQDNKLLP